jgi:hypothetical protein
MKPLVGLLFVLLLLSASAVWAKRGAPADVPPLAIGELELRAPHDQQGCVEAWHRTRQQLLWRRQVYVVKYSLDLERDVQDVFITSLEHHDHALRIKNERQSVYQLDLDTLAVTVVQGSLVEQHR